MAFWELAVSGQLWSALYESLRPFLLGYALAIVFGVPLGLLIGGFRVAEAALGIYVTAGYAMPLVALVPLLILWLGLGFAVKVAVVFLMALFPISINTWLGVVAVPKTLIEVGKSFVAPDMVILRRIVLPATLPYIMAGVRLAVGRAVVAMVIAEFFTTISGPWRGDHQFRQQLRHRHHVRADHHSDADGGRPELADRLGRAQRRALAGGNRGTGSGVGAAKLSWPGLTRPSMISAKYVGFTSVHVRGLMDCRVKPGNDSGGAVPTRAQTTPASPRSTRAPGAPKYSA